MPPTWEQRRRAEAEARAVALRERVRAGDTESVRHDIFGQIDESGIWLMFQPLKNLYGFYQRIEDVAGIVIHSGHPRSLQRYTAAHEYGHHVLGHTHSFDTQAEIEGRPGGDGDPLAEIEAQAFAGALLMPLHLVNHVAAEQGMDLAEPTAPHVYSMAVRFGVSYAAMRTQLRAYDLITRDAYMALDIAPVSIKEFIGDGEAPADRRADLWRMTGGEVPAGLPLHVADELILDVPETASTGYRWRFGIDASVLELVDDRSSELEDADQLGSERVRSLRFRAASPGLSRLHLGLSRAFGDQTEVAAVEVDVEVASPLTGEAESGLYVEQQAMLAARRR